MTRTKSKKRRINSRRRLRSKRLQRGGVVHKRLKLRKNQKDIRVFELTDLGIQWLPGAKVSLGRFISKKKSFAGKYRFIPYINIQKISPLDFVQDTFANTFAITYSTPSGRKTLTLDNLCHPCAASVDVPDLVKNFYDKLRELKNLERTGPAPRQRRRQGQDPRTACPDAKRRGRKHHHGRHVGRDT